MAPEATDAQREDTRALEDANDPHRKGTRALEDANKAERARECARVKRWQQEQRAKGLCRCGARIVPESRSRCWECLERCRRSQAARRGNPTKGLRRRGRPILGTLSVRRRAFEREERHRAWRAGRKRSRRA